MSEARPKLYLLDVEGTVAPLTLTTEVLFPYARAHFESFLWQSVEEIGNRIREMRDRGESDEAELVFAESSVWRDMMMLTIENGQENDPDAPRILPEVEENPGSGGERSCVSMSPDYAIPHVLEYIYWLMDRDRKSTALKGLQGKIWKTGFESGELKGTLFDDVPGAFKRWSKNARVAIYSSGSVEAQKLLFRHSVFGDLTPLIAGHFDTRTGAKMESASYAAIAHAMHVAPAEVLFFSDSVRELDAAREAGCGTRLVTREGNSPVEDAHGHAMIRSIDEAG
jgi:2,3-diketo-5-methylthio-1-phosphopentane phosphatase